MFVISLSIDATHITFNKSKNVSHFFWYKHDTAVKYLKAYVMITTNELSIIQYDKRMYYYYGMFLF